MYILGRYNVPIQINHFETITSTLPFVFERSPVDTDRLSGKCLHLDLYTQDL